ncbi:hypothetical protein [Nocardioides sp.]|uniref:hypothetical protein n=1 Tax=Nocardioides sp. TaxID=35761 RepID=UPI0027346CA1|nr:hypothetical protein [Nocardioides sp.]MDP3893310.1 hypothetical protein [Nocardioides sp.]
MNVLTEPAREGRSRWRVIRDGVGAATGVVLGVAPHVLHHIGLLAGTALISGASGNALFYVVGLILSVPMLRRLYRRFPTPWAPAVAVGVFTALFSLSAFVIGPAVSGSGADPAPTDPSPSHTGDEHGH